MYNMHRTSNLSYSVGDIDDWKHALFPGSRVESSTSMTKAAASSSRTAAISSQQMSSSSAVMQSSADEVRRHFVPIIIILNHLFLYIRRIMPWTRRLLPTTPKDSNVSLDLSVVLLHCRGEADPLHNRWWPICRSDRPKMRSGMFDCNFFFCQRKIVYRLNMARCWQ